MVRAMLRVRYEHVHSLGEFLSTFVSLPEPRFCGLNFKSTISTILYIRRDDAFAISRQDVDIDMSVHNLM